MRSSWKAIAGAALMLGLVVPAAAHAETVLEYNCRTVPGWADEYWCSPSAIERDKERQEAPSGPEPCVERKSNNTVREFTIIRVYARRTSCATARRVWRDLMSGVDRYGRHGIYQGARLCLTDTGLCPQALPHAGVAGWHLTYRMDTGHVARATYRRGKATVILTASRDLQDDGW